MGMMTDAKIAAWRQAAGISPATGERAEALQKMSELACDLIRIIALETSGIRDGDGNWYGSDPLAGTIADLNAEWARASRTAP